jgi:hypothetical protein
VPVVEEGEVVEEDVEAGEEGGCMITTGLVVLAVTLGCIISAKKLNKFCKL